MKHAYGAKYVKGGFTCRSGNCYSRLDYIFMPGYFVSKIVHTLFSTLLSQGKVSH